MRLSFLGRTTPFDSSQGRARYSFSFAPRYSKQVFQFDYFFNLIFRRGRCFLSKFPTENCTFRRNYDDDDDDDVAIVARTLAQKQSRSRDQGRANESSSPPIRDNTTRINILFSRDLMKHRRASFYEIYSSLSFFETITFSDLSSYYFYMDSLDMLQRNIE